MSRLFSVLTTGIVMAFAAGCGGAGDTTPVATNDVLLPKSYRFDPTAIRVQAGTSVTWTNEDNFTHTVKVEDGADHEIEPGETVTIGFPAVGTYRFVCTLHPHDMDGEVVVE